MAPGDNRTKLMTSIVGKMIAAIERGAGANINGGLLSNQQGRRLVAYVSLYVRPDAAYLIPLVDTTVDFETKHFGQYWGLRALRRLVETGGSESVDRNTLRQLTSLLPASSDRQYELARIRTR